MNRKYITSVKLALVTLIVLTATYHAFALHSVWARDYEIRDNFTNDYIFVAFPLFVMFLRVTTAKTIGLLGGWSLFILGFSAFLVTEGIFNHVSSSAVWFYALDILILAIGAFISLFMGWKKDITMDSTLTKHSTRPR